MDSITRMVLDQYSRYPFPSKAISRQELPRFLRRWARSPGHEMTRVAKIVARHLEGVPGPRRVLDAGCGTGEILLNIALKVPDVSIDGLDLSFPSLERARALVREEGVDNVTFHEHDLMEPLPWASEVFNVVVSIGVIHHLADSVVGLKNLRQCLARDGRLVCYLYGSLGRWDLKLKREAVSLLVEDESDFESKIRVVEALDLYPRRHASFLKESLRRIARMVRMVGGNRQRTRQAWIVDQLANVNEKEYTIAEIEDDLRAAGLELIELHGFPKRIEELLPQKDLRERARGLSRAQQLRFLELMIRPSGYLFSAGWAGS